jgi:phosphoglycerate dehydrogenase-like enzyme
MPDEKPVVLMTEGSDERPLKWLRERANVIEAASGTEAFDRTLPEAAGLAVRTYTRVDAALLARAPKLRVVGRGGVGIENIDVPACRKVGVQVVYTPDANTLAVGDFVFGYLLQILRPWNFFRDQAYAPAEFKRIRNTVRGRQLNEMTIGILGMGRVGRRVGNIASRGFGMRVLYNDLIDVSARVDFPAESVSKDRLYRESDILSLHVTMLPGNENLVGAEQLKLLKPASVVINTSRGEVLDAAALAQAIKSGHVYGAALDVYHPEPPGADFPLLGLDRVLLTPHLAARTYTAMENMSWVVKDIYEVLCGRAPRYPAP